MTSILLADDHAIVRAGLQQFIKGFIPDAEFDEAPDGTSALEKINTRDYNLIILDISMPGTDAFQLVAKTLNRKPESNILIFSISPEDTYARRFLQAGVMGYVNKDASITELANAITAILKHQIYISPSLRRVTGRIPIENNPFDLLSPRELEIVRLLIKGESLPGIRNALHIKSSTVSTYKARIFEKLNCKNVMDISQMAEMYGVVE